MHPDSILSNKISMYFYMLWSLRKHMIQSDTYYILSFTYQFYVCISTIPPVLEMLF